MAMGLVSQKVTNFMSTTTPIPKLSLGILQLSTAGAKCVGQQIVEPVFGIIKSAMGFRQFLLRGKVKVSFQWGLVTLAYSMRRLYTLGMRALMARAA
mgnify:CR=1 FL=1